ncbi:hypothetical protein AMECASPLE_010392 [Ameca splendens]|uniref:Transposase n=1 Tax=Ameca splendens TaxID=208324 RepID=A0ABV0YYD9_9TELE
MPQMTKVFRECAMGMLSIRAAACELNVNFSIISISKDVSENLAAHPPGLTAADHMTTPAQDLHIQHLHLQDHPSPATWTAAATIGLHNRRISAQTVRNLLREAHLHVRRPHQGLNTTAFPICN